MLLSSRNSLITERSKDFTSKLQGIRPRSLPSFQKVKTNSLNESSIIFKQGKPSLLPLRYEDLPVLDKEVRTSAIKQIVDEYFKDDLMEGKMKNKGMQGKPGRARIFRGRDRIHKKL